MIYKKKVNAWLKHSYIHYMKIVLCALCTVFVLGSLSSYYPYDKSSWYFSTAASSVHNLFGSLGAQCAALMWYLFGGGAFVLVGMLSFYLYLLICEQSSAAQWDRWVGWSLLLIGISSLFSLYRHDLIASITPGGLLGLRASSLFLYLFEVSGAFLFSYVLLLIGVVLLANFLLSYLFEALFFMCRIVSSREKFWLPIYRVSALVINKSSVALCKASSYLYSVLSGNIIKNNYLDLQHDDFKDIFEEQEKNNDFWQSYLTKSLKNELNHRNNSEEQAKEVPVYQGAQTPMPSLAHTAQQLEKKMQQTLQVEQGVEKKIMEPAALYALPAVDIFIGRKDEHDETGLVKELEKRAVILKEKLERFGVYGSVTAIKRGPVVTVFEYQPNIDSKISKIIALEDDLALALQALSIRIIAPIPGRSVVGFEVANTKCKKVSFAKVITSPAYQQFSGALPLLLGEDTIGADIVVDLARMPHLLIAGSTGSGKSVALNGMLTSLLCRMAPDELRLILIDPKRLEFAPYADIAHLIFPIVTDPKKAAPVLRFVIKEMEERYERMAKVNARNVFDYHTMTGTISSMPFMVVVIDELADLMMTAGREIEGLITRITQMARAAGIHMMVATQRPSVDVITGLIKVNFPSRISFRVTSKIDSRTILDSGGADKLLGRGDMLFLDSTSASIKRVHGAFVSDQEIAKVVNHIRSQQPASYLELPQESSSETQDLDDADDQLYQEVLDFLQTIDEISISLLQRRFRIGFNRSARIIDMLEARGVILPGHGGKTRKVIR